MNKITTTTILLLSSVVAFAQRERPTREIEDNVSVDPRSFDSSDSEVMFATPGGNNPTVPIDNYQFLLLGLAVLLIAYFVYRSRQAQQA